MSLIDHGLHTCAICGAKFHVYEPVKTKIGNGTWVEDMDTDPHKCKVSIVRDTLMVGFCPHCRQENSWEKTDDK